MRNKTKHVLKRALAVLMSMAVIFAAIPCYPAHAETIAEETTPSVSITSESVTAGNSTTLYVKASDFESVAGLEMAVHYDANAFDVSHAWTTGLSDGQVNDLNYATDGTVKYSMISVDGVSGSGYLLGINFNTTSETIAGDYPITVTVSDAYDVNFGSLSVGKTSGMITVKERPQTVEDIYFYSQLDKSSVETGDEFTYSLMTGYMSDLSGGNFEFTYDADALEVIDVSLAEELTSKTAVQSINTKNPGYIKVSYAAIEAIGASYWDKLIDITFKAKDKAYDSTSIVFSTTELVGEDLAAMSASKLTDNIKIIKPEMAVDNPDFILSWDGNLSSNRTIDVVAKLPADTSVAAGDFVITYDTDQLKCISAKADSAITGNGGYLVTKEDIGNGKVKFSYVTTKPSDKETALLNMTFEAVDQFIGDAKLSVKGTGVVDIDFKDIVLDYPDKTINIGKLDISYKAVSDIDDSYVYTGAAIKPVITIEGLRANIDYTVTYKNNTNVGEAEVIIEGKGNYSGKIEKSFIIVAAEITGVTAEPYEGVYDGKAHSITLNGVPVGATVTFAESKDGEYTSSPIRLQNAGTKTVYYKVSKDNYKDLYGSADIHIAAAPIDKMEVGGIEESYTFTGSDIEPKTTIEGLISGTDYEVSYAHNLNAGTAKVVVNGIGNYTGTIEKTFIIDSASIEDMDIEDLKASYVYTGDKLEPKATLDGLEKGIDYDVVYADNISVGTAKVTITGKGNYTGQLESTFEIINADMTGITAEGYSGIYDGKTHSITMVGVPEGAVVTFSDSKNGTYTDKELSILNVGSKTVYYKVDKANYNTVYGSAEIKITPADLSDMQVAGIEENYVYTGSKIKPEISIEGLIAGTDYTASYTDILNVGTAKVTITGIGNYVGSIEKTFEITPASINNLEANGIEESYVYTGSKISPEVSIEGLTAETDYKVAYSDNLNVGTAKVTITGIGNYEGTIEKRFEITPANIKGVEVAGYEGSYDGEAHTISLAGVPEGAVVTYAIEEDGEYTAEKPVLKNAGELKVYYKITLENHKDLTGSEVVKITPASIKNLDVAGIEEIYIYTGNKISPEVSIEGLIAGTDYEVVYSDNLNVGTAMVTITGVGNYDGTIEKTFKITPADIDGVEAAGYEGTYDGKAHTISLAGVPEDAVVTYAIEEDGEYTVEKPVLKNAGELKIYYKITLENHKNLTGSEIVKITPASIKNLEATGVAESYVYTGSKISPKVSIEGLTEETDYEVSYAHNLNAGTAKVTITGVGNYDGTIEKTFEITPASIEKLEANGIEESYVYTGSKISPKVSIEGLTAGTDYEVAYTDNLNVGTAKVTITGTGNYTGSIEKTFKVTQASIEKLEANGIEESYVYTGSKISPEVSIERLTAGTDYEIVYSDNLNVGTAKVTITGIGNYDGTIEKRFEITPANIKGVEVAGYEGSYDGEAHTISFAGVPEGAVVTYAIEEDGEYTAEKPVLKNAGELKVYYKITLENHKDLTGSEVVKITPASIKNLDVAGIEESYVYTGSKISPEVSIEGLTAGTDYEVAYENNLNVGTALITISGVGNYSGTITKSFNITPAELSGVVIKGFTGAYDGKTHSITIESEDEIDVVYATSEDGPYTIEEPDLVDVGTREIFYKISKDNYVDIKGSIQITVIPADIADMKVTGIDSEYIYTGDKISPEIAIEGFEKMDLGEDYEVSFSNNLNVGTAKVTITGKGNYDGTIEKTFEITPADITGVEAAGYEGTYDGEAHTISLAGVPEGAVVTYAIEEDGEFATEKPVLKNAGELKVYYKITLENHKDFTGSEVVKITPASIKNLDVAGIEESYIYTGNKISPEVNIDGLTAETDYEVSFSNNLNVGTAKATITGKGNYEGTIEKTFKITPADITGVEAAGYEGIYDGEAHTISLAGVPEGAVVTYAIEKDGEFTVEKPVLKNAGELKVYYRITLENHKELTGSEVVKILPANIDNLEVTGIEESYVYTGSKISPKVSIEGLTAGTDYEVAYANNLNVGTVKVTVTGIGNYTGSIEKTFKITPADIDNLEVTGIEEGYVYTGSKISPKVSIEGLTEGTDYTVAYTDNFVVGTAKVTITGKGNYEGSIVKTFEITPADIEGVVTSGYEGIYDGKSHTINLTGVPEGAVITYATDKDGEYTAEAPTIKNVGELKVYYKITLDNHKELTGSEVVKIDPVSIENLEATGIEESYTCTGTAIKPEIKINGLSGGVDYLVTYSDNTAAGIAKVIIEGKDNYTGIKEISFEIKHSFSNDWVSDSESHWHECVCGSIASESLHEFAWEVDEPATEDATGLKHEVCTVCEYTQSWDTVIDKLPHTHDMAKVDAVQPDCEKEGNIEHYKCNKCGKYYSDKDGNDELSWDDIVLDITDHSYSSDWHSNGTNHWFECKCGERTEITAHTFEWIEDRQPTEEAVGLKHEECSVCGYVRNENTEIDKLPHTHNIILVEAKEPTCTEEGIIKCYYCNKCHKYYYDEVAQLEIPENGQILPTEHKLSYQTRVEADCVNPGHIEHYSCSRCDVKFLDKDGTKQVPAGDEIISDLGHDLISMYDDEGHWKQCTRCDVKEDYAKHSLTWIIDSEATEDVVGSKHQECADCEYRTASEEIGKLPHTHKMTKIDAKEATCEEEGNVLYYSCDKCYKLYSDAEGIIEITQADTIIDAIGHDYSVTKTVAATTSKNGYRNLKCKMCGVTDKEDIYIAKTVTLSTSKYTYNGYRKAPSVTVKDSKGNVVDKANYSVSYASGRIKVGRYKVTVSFKNDYYGTKAKTAYFTIVPKAPSSASATLYGYDDVKFSWKKSTGASGYAVYYKKATSSKYTRLTRTTKLSIKKGNLSDGIQYKFKVVPYYKSGKTYYESTAYKEASIYTLKKLNTPVVTKSGSKVKVSWKNIAGETGYQISKTTKSGKTSIVATYKTTKGTYKTLTAKKGTKYYYKVRAYKQVGKTKIYGPWSKVKAYKR